MVILKTDNLTKHYGNITAIDNLQLSINSGEVYGLLGPNGSGKTTTLGVCTGVILPTSGTFTWFEGKYGDDYRRHTGTLLETPNFFNYLSATDNLKIVQQQKKSSDDKLDELLELVGLLERKTSKFKTFSYGMKQRLAIAATLIGSPDIIILDEPTNGLDPTGIADIRNIILNIAAMGKTIILASHILDEVEKVCTHVGILKDGKLLADGKVSSILSDDHVIEIASPNLLTLKNTLAELNIVKALEEKENYFVLTLSEDIFPEQLNRILAEKGIYVSRLHKVNKRLEDEFLSLINQS